jgi:hypothetical protein
MHYQFPSVQPELLSENNDDAVHQILQLFHSSDPTLSPSPAVCRSALFSVFCETLFDD